jgi:hypothetical protein
MLNLDMVPESYPLNDRQRLQVESYKTKSSHIDREPIRKFLKMYAFEQLIHETDENRIREMRRYLWEYCRRDTLAMVRIFEVLESV